MSDIHDEKLEDLLDNVTAEDGEFSEYCDEHGLDLDFMRAASLKGMVMLSTLLDEEVGPNAPKAIRQLLERFNERIEREFYRYKDELEES